MQPANSPDTNINDLCFFSSLASAVSKVHTPDPEALAKAVEDKYWTWHSTAKLAKLWQLKTAVCGCIWLNDGDNDYKLPHNVEGSAGARAPQQAKVGWICSFAPSLNSGKSGSGRRFGEFRLFAHTILGGENFRVEGVVRV